MKPNKIGIIGCGYVGLITGVCLADLGNQVICHDIDQEKIRILQQGSPPFYEKGLQDFLKRNQDRLTFTTSIDQVIQDSDYLFISVGSPSTKTGAADTRAFNQVIDQIQKRVTNPKVIVIKSTLPVGTAQRIKQQLKGLIDQGLIDVISNPEFLREGNSIYDFMNPDRIVIGAESNQQAKKAARLYDSFTCPILLVSNEDAELIKYASNNFLATKISFINEIANICQQVGADILQVAYGIGLDHRIGHHFLQAGLGFGGPCLNKDLQAMISFSKNQINYDPHLLEAVLKINDLQPGRLLHQIKKLLKDFKGQRFGLLGLSFKPGTSDMRNAPSLNLISALLQEGAEIIAYDPKANLEAGNILKNQIQIVDDPYLVSENTSAILIATEWPEFCKLDYQKIFNNMKEPLLIDGRNIFDKDDIEKLEQIGFQYLGVGRNISLND